MDLGFFFLVYGLVMGGILFSIFFIILYKVRGKIKVRVKSPVGEKEYLRKPNRDGTSITVFKQKKKTPEWTFNFSTKALYFTKKLFFRALTLDVFSEATKAIEYDFDLEDTKQPKYRKEEAEEWIQSRSLKKYMEGVDSRANMLTMITVILIVVNLAMSLVLILRLP